MVWALLPSCPSVHIYIQNSGREHVRRSVDRHDEYINCVRRVHCRLERAADLPLEYFNFNSPAEASPILPTLPVISSSAKPITNLRGPRLNFNRTISTYNCSFDTL